MAIVESEKTAVIASVYLPQFVWLAFGGIGFNIDKCHVLKGRNVTLFPDLNGFDKWSSKAKELSHLATFTVSDLLECKATEAERKQGFDLADYLIKYDYKAFFEATEAPPAVQPWVEVKAIGQTVSDTFARIKAFPRCSHLNYHDDLERSGYYDALLNWLDIDKRYYEILAKWGGNELFKHRCRVNTMTYEQLMQYKKEVATQN